MVDLAQLRSGLDALDGSVSDALNVLVRDTSELQKMTTNAQLLLQRQNVAAGAFDNWSSIIAGLNARHTSFHEEILAASAASLDGTGSEAYGSWDAFKAFTIEIATASDQLESELNPSSLWIVALIAVVAGLVAFYIYEKRAR
ncbi:MAG: hypothetical protein JWM53_3845 [bacterium]|nr:hypothetical protein [bacterium]